MLFSKVSDIQTAFSGGTLKHKWVKVHSNILMKTILVLEIKCFFIWKSNLTVGNGKVVFSHVFWMKSSFLLRIFPE